MKLAQSIVRFFLLLAGWVALAGFEFWWNVPAPPPLKVIAFSPAQIEVSIKWTKDWRAVRQIYLRGGCDASLSTATVNNANGFDPRILAAMVVVESHCDTQAVSNKGAVGLLQVMVYHVPPAEIGRLIEPEYNLRVGGRIIQGLVRAYGLYGGLAAYSGFTRGYPEKVLARLNTACCSAKSCERMHE